MSQNKQNPIKTALFGGLLVYYFLTGNALLTPEQKLVPSSPAAIVHKAELQKEIKERKEKAKKEGKNVSYDIDIGEDNAFSRYFGLFGSIPFKTFFWSWDMGRYPSERVVKTIEDAVQDRDLNGLKIRIGHNDVWQDTARLFNDKEVVKRTPGWYRVIFGIPSTILGESFSELSRTDYYNPITNSTILYSNVEGIALHEIGHAKDFERFDRPWNWIYMSTRALPPVMLYQEWRASFNYAKQDLPKEKKYHASRFLAPAFGIYCLAVLNLVAMLAKRKKH